jgi:hypothetical protein
MSKLVAISPVEAADRLAIREFVEASAHCKIAVEDTSVIDPRHASG